MNFSRHQRNPSQGKITSKSTIFQNGKFCGNKIFLAGYKPVYEYGDIINEKNNVANIMTISSPPLYVNEVSSIKEFTKSEKAKSLSNASKMISSVANDSNIMAISSPKLYVNDEPSFDHFTKSEMAEALSNASKMTSPAAGRRLAARKIEFEIGLKRDSIFANVESIPPKELLMYLVRMGSFNSTPKINNVDSQDDNIVVPQGLTYTDLVRHCKLMRGIERPELLTRSFYRPCALFNQDLTDSIRNFHLNSNFNQELTSPNSIRILQWNILSQSLGQGSDGFVMCPDEALSWENRKFLIVQEIVQNNPDIVCLQEVDHFKFLQRILETQDYEGFFFPKPDSPCLYINDNNGPDGCAVFYKKNKFDLINCDSRILEVWRVQTNQVTIAANLRVRESGKEICICTTHLKARNGALMSKLRNEQGKDLLNFISDFAEGRPLIMCGDFNAEPIEPIYHTVLSYPDLGLSSAYSDLLKRENNNIEEPYQTESKNSPKLEINGCNKDTDINDVVEQSAANEPPYTTWKVREDGEVCHTIDYVFYTKDKLEANNCLMFPDANEIGDNRTPSFRYPSDHFSLICDFQFRD